MLILLSGKQQTVPKLEGLSSNGGVLFLTMNHIMFCG